MKDNGNTHDHDHDHEKIRVKDATVNIKDLEDNVKAFYFDLASGLENYYPEGGYELIVTSGKRQPKDGVGKAKNTSRHNTGQAIDLRADEKVYNYLYNTKEGLEKMVKYNIGLLDETSKETMSKTGATGPHLHLGYDSNLVSKVKERYSVEDNSFQHIPMGGKGSEVIPAKTSTNETNAFVLKDGGKGYIVTDVVEAPLNYLEEDFKKDILKTKNTEDKIQSSEERKQLEQLKYEEQKKIAFLNAIQENTVNRKQEPQEKAEQYREQGFEALNLQQDLPNIPTIFKNLT